MQERAQPKIKNQVHQERDGRVWWACVVGVIGGILVAAGFAYAAHQHFTALESGAKNVELRKQREQLKNERKRLMLERETALSPEHLEKSALKIGLQSLNAKQIKRFGDFSPETPGEELLTAEAPKTKVETAKKTEKQDSKRAKNN